jgi:hypothetical protein
LTHVDDNKSAIAQLKYGLFISGIGTNVVRAIVLAP